MDVEWNDDVVWEIALRLPTKSLMRFKSVSKHWNTMIRDPFFAKSHSGGFRGLHMALSAFTTIDYHNIQGVANSSFGVGNSFIMRGYPSTVKKKTKIPGCHQLLLGDEYVRYYLYRVTNIEKGLCVISKPVCCGVEFILCNVATHELLDLPIKCPKEDREDQCFLGFDPVRGVYKLVQFLFDKKYKDIDASSNCYCEGYLQICTIGGEGDKDLDWRSIDEPAQLTCAIFENNICLNGILYLTTWPDDDEDHDNLTFAAFDLSAETTPQIIPVPDSCTSGGQPIQLGGRLGLIHLTHEVGTIWVLKENKAWTKSHCVDLRGICRISKCESEFSMGICGFDINYLGTLPTGEVLLAPFKVSVPNNQELPVYKYDHIRNKLSIWTELCIPNVDSMGGKYQICYHEDNIVQLDSVIARSTRSLFKL